MTVRCELIDYDHRDWDYGNPRVVIADAYPDANMVRIKIGTDDGSLHIVKVDGKELIAAAERCMNTSWPNSIYLLSQKERITKELNTKSSQPRTKNTTHNEER